MFNPRKFRGTALRPQDVIRKWRILKGDLVQVMRGTDSGKQGLVNRVFRKRNTVIVDNANMTKRHVRKGMQAPRKKGGETQPEIQFTYASSPIHVSNVMLVDPTDGKPTRTCFKFLEDGTKVRISKRTGAMIPKPPVRLARTENTAYVSGAKDTDPEFATLETFDPDTLNPLKAVSLAYQTWTLQMREEGSEGALASFRGKMKRSGDDGVAAQDNQTTGDDDRGSETGETTRGSLRESSRL